MDLFWLSYVNASMCALNVALYVGLDEHHWWNASVAVLAGLIALLVGMQTAGRR